MKKIIFNVGLLAFFISIIIFSQQGMLVQDILLRSFIVFFVVTLMLTIFALTFIKAVNKISIEKQRNYYR